MSNFNHPDAIILCGGLEPNGDPRIGTEIRSIEAARLGQNMDIPRMIFSGGSSYWDNNNHNGKTEARVAHGIASMRGLSDSKEIILEEESHSIIENLAYTADLLNESDSDGVLIIIGKLFIPRVKKVCKIALDKPFEFIKCIEPLDTKTFTGEGIRLAMTHSLTIGLKHGDINKLHERELDVKQMASTGKRLLSATIRR